MNEYNKKINIGINADILFEIKSELNIIKRKTGILMAQNDNNVGRKLQGPKSILPHNLKYISPDQDFLFNINFLFSSLDNINWFGSLFLISFFIIMALLDISLDSNVALVSKFFLALNLFFFQRKILLFGLFSDRL